MYKPLCDNPLLLVNRAALNYALKGFPVHGCFAHYLRGHRFSEISQGYLLSKAKTDDEIIATSYVEVGDYKEPLFQYVPCGHCVVCRDKKRNDLVFRAAMESACYDCPPVFFTLTYAPKYLPQNGNLRYKDVQDFFKRLRRKWDRDKVSHDIRYMVAGEYGSKYGRPHYHVIMWNNPYHCDEFNPLFFNKLRDDIFFAWGKCIDKSFDFGQVYGGAAAYAAKYMSKESATHGHQVKPFIHTSRGRGGLGSRLIDQKKDYLRNNPQLRELVFVDNFGKLQHVQYSSYITGRVWPSPSRLVPSRLRCAYRQLVELLHFSCQCRVLSITDALELDELLRPGKDVIPSSFDVRFASQHVEVSSVRLRTTYRPRFKKVFVELADILSEVYEFDSQYIAQYFNYKLHTPAQQVQDIVSRHVKIAQKLAHDDSLNKL